MCFGLMDDCGKMQDATNGEWRCVALWIILDFPESKYLLTSGFFEGKIEILTRTRRTAGW
jgi:hypothetical protein